MTQLMPTTFRKFFKTTRLWKNNKLILQELKHFPQVPILAVFFSCLSATFEGVTVGFLLSFLQSLATPHSPPVKTGWDWFDTAILNSDGDVMSRLYRICILIVLSTWARAVVNYFSYVYGELVQLYLTDSLRKRVFDQLESLPLSFFATSRSGELINTLTTEIERLKQWMHTATYLFTRVLTLTVYFIWMFLLSWQLTILAFMLFALIAVALSNLNKQVRESSFAIPKASGEMTSIAIEFINGIRTVNAFATHKLERDRFYKASNGVVNASSNVTKIWSLVKPLAEVFAITILMGLIILGFTIFKDNGTIQVGFLLTYFFVLFRCVPIVQDMNGMRAYLSTLVGAAENIQQLLSTKDKKYMLNGNREFTGLKHGIDLVSVDFAYDTGNRVLDNVTLTIEPGKMTALVGSSGSGKSTLVDLIPRFHDPISGQVAIDGVDLREFKVESLRRRMAIVSQDTFIFNASVWNNIAYGMPEAKEAEIREAAQLANALEFIDTLPEGFDTILGDRGVRLSGGQRQRIAIARALLRNPEILILDEATSALDSISERLIQESIEKLSVGRTVIAIAHRLSTVAQADKVVVLEKGRIVEQGNYKELLELRGNLWQYHQMQH